MVLFKILNYTWMVAVLTLYFVNLCNAAKNYDVDITKYESLQNKANVTNYGTLRLVKISRNTFRISGDFQIYRNLGNEVIARLEIYKKDGLSNKYNKLLAKSSPLCDFLKDEKMVYPDLKQVSNLPPGDKCPFPEGSYSIKEYLVKEEKLPDFASNGHWRVKCYFANNGEVVGGFEVDVTITSTPLIH